MLRASGMRHQPQSADLGADLAQLPPSAFCVVVPVWSKYFPHHFKRATDRHTWLHGHERLTERARGY